MTGDWAAVAKAAKDRMVELRLKQREVEEIADLSKATVREILNNVKPRHRKARTLEALSIALQWHPDHLAAILERRTPPELGAPPAKSANDIPGRLDVIEHRLNQMDKKLDDAEAASADRFSELRTEVRTELRQVVAYLRTLGH